MNAHPWKRWYLILALPVIVGVFYFTASAHFTYTPDDTYIYLRFAQNLVQGNGISFNPGVPSYGITSPLWLFIISLGGAMGVDIYLAAKVVDLVFASLGLIVFYFLAYELIRDSAVAICATVAFSVNAWYMRWAGSGMETSLSVFLMLAAFLFCVRNEYWVAIVLAALLTLVRPEAILVVPVMLADVYLNSQSKRRALQMGAAMAVIFLVLLAPWMIYAQNTFGAILPTTALAKASWHPGIAELTSTGLDIIKTFGAADGVAAVVLIVGAGILIVMRKMLVDADGTDHRLFLFRQSVAGLGWIALILIFYLVMDVNVVSRYLLLVTPMVTILAFSYLYHVLLHSRIKRFAYVAVILLAGLVMMQNVLWYRLMVAPGIVLFEQGMETCLIPIGRWLHDRTPPEARVLTGDIGAIGYYSERFIEDAAGLITPAILPILRQGHHPYEIIEQKLYEQCCTPDYIVDRSPQRERLKAEPNLLALFVRPFIGMSLSEDQIIYYTIYKVHNHVKSGE